MSPGSHATWTDASGEVVSKFNKFLWLLLFLIDCQALWLVIVSLPGTEKIEFLWRKYDPKNDRYLKEEVKRNKRHFRFGIYITEMLIASLINETAQLKV